jgi:hypothetical protein
VRKREVREAEKLSDLMLLMADRYSLVLLFYCTVSDFAS